MVTSESLRLRDMCLVCLPREALRVCRLKSTCEASVGIVSEGFKSSSEDSPESEIVISRDADGVCVGSIKTSQQGATC